MKRQKAPVRVNQFVGGLNTETNPLSFPPTASIDESNMDINTDGSRSRRFGFDVEENFLEVSTNIVEASDQTMARGQFLWENPGNLNNLELMVIQLGNYFAVHNLNYSPLSAQPIFSKTFSDSTYSQPFGFTVVDGTLVVATGERAIYTYVYEDGEVVESETTLLIRDLFGVEDFYTTDGQTSDLGDIDNIQLRPTTLSGPHTYNLRNQTFALPRVDSENNTDLKDPLERFFSGSEETVFPSNADNAIAYIFADANLSSEREVERFFGDIMFKSPPSTTKAPLGYFIIDAMARGNSREEQEAKLRGYHPELEYEASGFLRDETSGGAKVVAQYSGRVWYGGFSGETISPNQNSPKLSSYILFSQVVQSPNYIGLCYQVADPTSINDPDLVDTDGGFIKIDGAYNIKALVPVDSSLFVLAENGVWRVVGTDENTFNATGYSVSKVSDEGIISKNSAVVAGKTLTYWGEDAIYTVATNELGDWGVTNTTQNTIQTYYDEISQTHKATSIGYYDSKDLIIRWVWGFGEDSAEELVLNLKYNAFTKNSVVLPEGVSGITSVHGGAVPEGALSIPVTSGGSTVTSGGEDVEVLAETVARGISRLYYCVILNSSEVLSYTFGQHNQSDISYDWVRYGESTDSPAFLLTGSITGGDARLKKDVPYLGVYLKEGLEDPTPSCVLTARWDWSHTYENGRWSSPRQIYRPKSRQEEGGLLATRNKIRGSGRSVAFRFDAEAGRPMHIYGWEFNLEATAFE